MVGEPRTWALWCEAEDTTDWPTAAPVFFRIINGHLSYGFITRNKETNKCVKYILHLFLPEKLKYIEINLLQIRTENIYFFLSCKKLQMYSKETSIDFIICK